MNGKFFGPRAAIALDGTVQKAASCATRPTGFMFAAASVGVQIPPRALASSALSLGDREQRVLSDAGLLRIARAVPS
jgi:hypothetical protein